MNKKLIRCNALTEKEFLKLLDSIKNKKIKF
jgi:hypothetical protein